jgi:hypothetical protein
VRQGWREEGRELQEKKDDETGVMMQSQKSSCGQMLNFTGCTRQKAGIYFGRVLVERHGKLPDKVYRHPQTSEIMITTSRSPMTSARVNINLTGVTPAVRFCVAVAVTPALRLVRLDCFYPCRTPLCAGRVPCYPRHTPSCALQLSLPPHNGDATDIGFTLRAGRLTSWCARKAVVKLLHEKYFMRSLTGWMVQL